MTPLYLNFDINKLSTDEEITLILGTSITRHPALANVICGLDPFSIEPPNFSGEWYLYNSEAPQFPNRGSSITETESGFWKIKKDCRIFTYTSCVGRKSTMEFYDGKLPNGNRTRWTMHKYQAEEKISNGFYNKKDYNISLYRVFLQNDQTDYEVHYSSAGCEFAIELRLPILQEPEQISPSRDVLNRPLGKSASSRSLRERLNESFMNDINATWDPTTEGFVKMNDFCDPEHAELTVSIGKQRQSVDYESQGELYEDYLELNDIWQRQSVDSERQGELYSGEDYLELNDMCSVASSNPMDEDGQSTCSESISEYLNENTVKDTYRKNDFSNEEYLELNDLCSPGTSSSSSDNSSHMSIDSDDYYDSGPLLQSVRDEGYLGEEERTIHMFCVSSAAESNQFFIRLPSPGSAHSNNNIAVEESAPASSLPENEISHQEFLMSNDNRPNMRDDSKTGKSEAKETNQATDCMQVRGRTKVSKIAEFVKKCCCFGPF